MPDLERRLLADAAHPEPAAPPLADALARLPAPRRRRTVLLVGAASLAAVLVAVGVALMRRDGPHPRPPAATATVLRPDGVRIIGAVAATADDRVTLTVDGCRADGARQLNATARSVTVLVAAPLSTGPCPPPSAAPAVGVTLRRPLAGRALIDASTGATIRVFSPSDLPLTAPLRAAGYSVAASYTGYLPPTTPQVAPARIAPPAAFGRLYATDDAGAYVTAGVSLQRNPAATSGDVLDHAEVGGASAEISPARVPHLQRPGTCVVWQAAGVWHTVCSFSAHGTRTGSATLRFTVPLSTSQLVTIARSLT